MGDEIKQDCWACWEQEATVSLDGYGKTMCRDCWNSMSVFEKMMLQTLQSQEVEQNPVAIVLDELDNTLKRIAELHFDVGWQ